MACLNYAAAFSALRASGSEVRIQSIHSWRVVMTHDRHSARAPFSILAAVSIVAIPCFAQGGTNVEPSTSFEASVLLEASQAYSASCSGLEMLPPATLAGKASKGGAKGSRAGKPFTPAGKREIDAANAAKNGGANKCENCGTDVVPGEKSQRGVPPPSNQRERDHIIPKSKGGDGTPSNGQVLCRECNLEKSDQAP